jgi:hypothetical protein
MVFLDLLLLSKAGFDLKAIFFEPMNSKKLRYAGIDGSAGSSDAGHDVALSFIHSFRVT